MALFGQLTKPTKQLPLIDVSNPDIVMELLEELAITVSTSQWIKDNEPFHPEAADIHDQAQDVYSDLLGIFQGKVHDKRINKKVRWAGALLCEHLARHEENVEGDVIELLVDYSGSMETWINLAKSMLVSILPNITEKTKEYLKKVNRVIRVLMALLLNL